MELGQKVSFSKIYKRESEIIGDGFKREWKEKEVEEKTGIFIGYRNLINSCLDTYYCSSVIEYDPLDVKNEFYGKAALIAINKRDLVKVPIDNLTAI